MPLLWINLLILHDVYPMKTKKITNLPIQLISDNHKNSFLLPSKLKALLKKNVVIEILFSCHQFNSSPKSISLYDRTRNL